MSPQVSQKEKPRVHLFSVLLDTAGVYEEHQGSCQQKIILLSQFISHENNIISNYIMMAIFIYLIGPQYISIFTKYIKFMLVIYGTQSLLSVSI